MKQGFNKAGFMAYLENEFSGFDHAFLRQTVENIVNYALEKHNFSLDQLGYFLSDMLPEVEFADVAAFMDDSQLTAHGREVKAESLHLIQEKALENKVYTIDEIHNWPYQITDLIATYEDLYEVPEADRVTEYFGEYGQNFLKSVVSFNDAKEISAAYRKALKAVDMTADEFFGKKDCFVYRSAIEDLIKRKMLSPLDDKIMVAEGQKAEENVSQFFENIER